MRLFISALYDSFSALKVLSCCLLLLPPVLHAHAASPQCASMRPITGLGPVAQHTSVVM